MELLSKQTGQNITSLLCFLLGCIDFDTFGIHSILFRGSYLSSSQCGNKSVTHSNLDNVPIVTKCTCMDCFNIDILLHSLSKVTCLCSKVVKSRTCQSDGSIILLPNGHWFLNHGCFTNWTPKPFPYAFLNQLLVINTTSYSKITSLFHGHLCWCPMHKNSRWRSWCFKK